MTIGKEAVMADASEAIGQNVQEKAANKLGGHQSHARDARFMPIVLPGEGDMIVRDVDKTMIGDGDTMSIAAEVTQDLFRTGKGSLGVDDPVETAEGSKVGGECTGVGEIHEIGEKA